MGEEEIAGLVTALKFYLQQDFAAEEQMWEDMVAFMVADLKDAPGLCRYPGKKSAALF